jgi:hypothetical protein
MDRCEKRRRKREAAMESFARAVAKHMASEQECPGCMFHRRDKGA